MVVTDSSTCLPPSLLRELPVRTVPLMVHLRGRDCEDGTDGLLEETFQAIADGEPVASSPPTVVELVTALEAAGGPVVVVTPAREFTAIYAHAEAAAALAHVAARVVDSRTAAAGQGLVVLEGARAAAAGAGLDDVAATVRAAVERVDLVATVSTVAMLKASGRVPITVVEEGGQLVFRMRHGRVEPLGEVEDEDAALHVVATEAAAGRRRAVFHAAAPDRAAELARRLGDLDFVASFSAAMAVSTGPGVVGAAWLR